MLEYAAAVSIDAKAVPVLRELVSSHLFSASTVCKTSHPPRLSPPQLAFPSHLVYRVFPGVDGSLQTAHQIPRHHSRFHRFYSKYFEYKALHPIRLRRTTALGAGPWNSKEQPYFLSCLQGISLSIRSKKTSRRVLRFLFWHLAS